MRKANFAPARVSAPLRPIRARVAPTGLNEYSKLLSVIESLLEMWRECSSRRLWQARGLGGVAITPAFAQSYSPPKQKASVPFGADPKKISTLSGSIFFGRTCFLFWGAVVPATKARVIALASLFNLILHIMYYTVFQIVRRYYVYLLLLDRSLGFSFTNRLNAAYLPHLSLKFLWFTFEVLRR